MTVNVIGAGLAGLSASAALAKQNIRVNLISVQPSERAQSIMAEGGINGAINVMGEDDAPENHIADTLRGGVYLNDPEAVRNLCENAPGIIRWFEQLGAAFNAENGHIIQRNFGGQKKKRTAYARSSTGKILMTVLIDEVRKYELSGLVTRYSHHEFEKLLFETEAPAGGAKKKVAGVLVKDTDTDRFLFFKGPVIMCCGGLNGIFPDKTTGTTANSGQAAATLFSQGVRLGNLEMIQYHPTTIAIPGKRCLVSEAARGEGGRLYTMVRGKRWYFMEELYPELKNLSPRDVVSREMYFIMTDRDPEKDGKIWLDLTGLSGKVWKNRLPDLRAEIIRYLAIDPAEEPVPVEPGIHYFMGGIHVDRDHRTNAEGLFAAGECCDLYHGANRLGANSMLGAVYGGRRAAETLASEADITADETGGPEVKTFDDPRERERFEKEFQNAGMRFMDRECEILYGALGIVRNEEGLRAAATELDQLGTGQQLNKKETARLLLGRAMLLSALERRESRGAQYRSDFPEKNDAFRSATVAEITDGAVKIGFDDNLKNKKTEKEQ